MFLDGGGYGVSSHLDEQMSQEIHRIIWARKDEGRNSKNEWLQSLSERVFVSPATPSVPLKVG